MPIVTVILIVKTTFTKKQLKIRENMWWARTSSASWSLFRKAAATAFWKACNLGWSAPKFSSNCISVVAIFIFMQLLWSLINDSAWDGIGDLPPPVLSFPGLSQAGGGGALCVEMGFYADISWESRRNIEINVCGHFHTILLVFEVPYRPWVKWMPEKS